MTDETGTAIVMVEGFKGQANPVVIAVKVSPEDLVEGDPYVYIELSKEDGHVLSEYIRSAAETAEETPAHE